MNSKELASVILSLFCFIILYVNRHSNTNTSCVLHVSSHLLLTEKAGGPYLVYVFKTQVRRLTISFASRSSAASSCIRVAKA